MNAVDARQGGEQNLLRGTPTSDSEAKGREVTVVACLLEHWLPKPRVAGWYVLQVHHRQTPPHKFIEFPLFLADIGKKYSKKCGFFCQNLPISARKCYICIVFNE